MKKIIIAATVMMSAVFANAASYYWKATSMTDMKGDTLNYDVVMSVYCDTLGGKFESSATVSNGSILAGEDTLFEDAAFEVGTVYKFYVTYQDKEGNTFTSALKGSKASSTSQPTLAFTMANGSWQAVPEPTSGLLLLLGVAGLALKRKRA